MGDQMTFETLKAMTENPWFKLLARGAMVALLPLATGIGGLILWLMADVAQVSSTQTARAADNDRFQSAIIGDVTEVKEGVALVQTDVNSVKLDIALMRGWIEEMRRRDIAQANAARWSPMGSAPAPPN